ncbi:hypothetical protein Hanom_Chr02g00133501 [Helianthus anomalus]
MHYDYDYDYDNEDSYSLADDEPSWNFTNQNSLPNLNPNPKSHYLMRNYPPLKPQSNNTKP